MKDQIEIILIEDNPDDAELTMRALKKYNIVNSIKWLKDGAEALDFLELIEKGAEAGEIDLPRLILLDLKLPKVNGLEVLEKTKKSEHLKLIPLVVLTSSNEETDILKSYNLGVSSYIVKPMEFDAFLEAVRNIGMYWILLNKTI